jgi:hypothetical protein
MHVGARYYDALVGRFISADTYLGDIGNPQSLNRYAYVENDPVNHVDPTGHKPLAQGLLHFAEGIGISAGGIGLIGGTTTTTTTVSTTTTTVTTKVLWGLITRTVVTEAATTTTTAAAGGLAITATGVVAALAGIAVTAYGAYEVSDWWVNNTSSGSWVTTQLGNLIYAITDGR